MHTDPYMEDISLNKKSDEVTMTYSSVLTKDGKPLVSVRFERGSDFAEGELPECRITKSRGFSVEEKDRLADYLKSNRGEIIEQAKSISGLFNILGR